MSNSTCPDKQNISEFNYETTRKNNMNNIKSYYNKTLNKYTSIYRDYLNKSSDSDSDINEQAEFELKEKGDITDLNNHLIDIKRNLNGLIQEDTKNILIQKNKIDNEQNKIKMNKSVINKLTEILNKNEGKNDMYQDSYKETSKRNDDNTIYHYISIVICGCLLAYLVYLIYIVFVGNNNSSSINNSNSFLNNIRISNNNRNNNARNNRKNKVNNEL